MDALIRKPSVLIVDDDYYFGTDVLGYHLKRRGFDVIFAYTASEFRNCWQKADVILLDIRLPDKEGDPIDPWAGLKTLQRIVSGLPPDGYYPQIQNCIIRSAQTKTDAVTSSIEIPRHYKWLSPDVAFSDVVNTISEAAEINLQGMEP